MKLLKNSFIKSIFLTLLLNCPLFANDIYLSEKSEKIRTLTPSSFITNNSHYRFDSKISTQFRWAMAKITKGNFTEKVIVPVINGKFTMDIYLRQNQGVYKLAFYGTTDFEKFTRYQLIQSGSITNLDYRNMLYLLPSQQVQSNHLKIKSLAAAITQKAKNQTGKVLLINDWIVKNIKYDYQSIEDLSYLDTPSDALYSLNSKTGVCGAFAALFAALVRSQDIPVKIVKGEAYTNSGWLSHAWNEVYLDGKWKIVDPTWNATALIKNSYIFPDSVFFNTQHRKIRDYQEY